ncbi:hypothetical protein C1O40_05850 [Akkermansia muciniphila]|nr:hypothetical protein C1O40_05850 [Akkermansia muciniphila]QAA50429.1 hypothetical protein C1O47_05745 [Akkermansia muciniphila]QAA61966.1 hypothetical protein C1O59_05470 [Akkermansia muciniphila]QAA68728.1 hypothetical protein C1O62_05525 [Akkermansia muciniphila]
MHSIPPETENMLSGNLPRQPRERSRGQAPPAPAHFGIPRGRIRAASRAARNSPEKPDGQTQPSRKGSLKPPGAFISSSSTPPAVFKTENPHPPPDPQLCPQTF